MIRAVRSTGHLVIKGHAGCAPRGQDLVCAAVSILAETLRATLSEGAVELGDGTAEFWFREPCPAAEFVCTGLELLAEAYPQSVKYEVV